MCTARAATTTKARIALDCFPYLGVAWKRPEMSVRAQRTPANPLNLIRLAPA